MSQRFNPLHRRAFIGGSDARIIMGDDEGALLRLWREKRGEVEPEDLSGNLIVQLGLITEPLNRQWYERNSGQRVKDVQRRVDHPVIRWMAATLDGLVEGTGAVFAKAELKGLMPEDAKEAIGHGIRAKRSKSGAVSFDVLSVEAAPASEVLAQVVEADSGLDTDHPRMGSGEVNNPDSDVGGGIDKSALAISEPRRYRDKEHRKFVSAQACLVCGRQPSDPDHLRFAQPRALGRKVSDEFTVPLCRIHHREVHRGSDEATWWNRFSIDPYPYLVAAALWAQTRPVRSVAEFPNHNASTAPPAATPDPASVARRPNGTRNRKTKPIIAAGAQ
jgi:hypothetical protein